MSHAPCPQPCPEAERLRHNLSGLRQHLLNSHECLDSWLALSELIPYPQQRKDCLERAAALAPDNLDIQQQYLEAVLLLE
ncbi:MAG: hypothetical protein MUD01_15220, partial [Chloroflexaceae bacterium]|nr:hypothetical protein [Chloroflexaceae bacterium]